MRGLAHKSAFLALLLFSFLFFASTGWGEGEEGLQFVPSRGCGKIKVAALQESQPEEEGGGEEGGGTEVQTFTIGGTVTGLAGTLVLQNNFSDDLTITADGSFTFLTPLESETDYGVTVTIQPSVQTCTVTNGTGTVSGANVTNVSVNCLSADPQVSSLNLSIGSLSPTFDSDTTSYTATVGFLNDSMTITPTSSDAGASMTVNGTSVSSGSSSDPISLNVGANAITIGVTAADGATTETYSLTVTRESTNDFAQLAYIKASNTEANDALGESVAIDGDTMVAGAIQEDSNATGVNGNESNNSIVGSGAAYVYVRNGSTWSQQAYLKASNPGGTDFFGRSVAISGDTIVVGAEREDSSATGVDGDETDNSVGDSGAAYVFVRNGTTWSQQAYLKASNTDGVDIFGNVVSVSGDTIVVGAPGEDSDTTGVNGDDTNNNSSSTGAAYVFVRDGTTWSQQAYLKASNTAFSDFFGRDVSISGDTIVVGANGEDSNATGVNGDESNNSASTSGAAYVFVRNGTTWTQQAYLKASNTQQDDQFGMHLAISDDTIVVGARLESSDATGVDGDETNNNKSGSGAAYVFFRNGTTWSQQAYLKASNTDASDQFGRDVAVSGDAIAVASRAEDSNATGVNGDDTNNSTSASGAVYVFVRSGTSWSQQLYLKASNTAGTDFFGTGLAISGDTVVVGANNEDSNATGINGDDSNDSAAESGAAYVYQ